MYNQTAVLPVSKERAAYLQKQKRKKIYDPDSPDFGSGHPAGAVGDFGQYRRD